MSFDRGGTTLCPAFVVDGAVDLGIQDVTQVEHQYHQETDRELDDGAADDEDYGDNYSGIPSE